MSFALIFYQASIRPLYNWDMIPYMASVLSIEQQNFQKIHSNTYQLIKNELPDTIFAKLTRGDYRNSSYTSYKFLKEQESLYINRPLYILLVYSLYKIGFDLIFSTYLVSLVTGLFTSALLFLWLLKFYKMGYSFILTLVLIAATGLRETAKYSTLMVEKSITP